VQDMEKDIEAKLPVRAPAAKPPTIKLTPGG
jgi:hypothetical protein